MSDLVGDFLTGLTLITQISGLFFKLTGITILGIILFENWVAVLGSVD